MPLGGPSGGKNAKDARGKQGAAGKGGMGTKTGGSKSGGFGSKPGVAVKSGSMGSKSGQSGSFGAKPGTAKPGGFGAKPSGAKPGGFGSSTKPGMGGKPSGSGFGSKPLPGANKSGGTSAAGKAVINKPTATISKPGTVAKPGTVMKPGTSVKPGVSSGVGTKPGTTAGMGTKPGSGTRPITGMGAKSSNTSGLGGKPATNSIGGGLGAKSGTASSAGGSGKAVGGAASVVRAGAAGVMGAKVVAGLKHKDTSQTEDRIEPGGYNRSTSVNGGHDAQYSGMSRNIPLSQMDRLDITKMSPRELMMLERQYGAGWLKTLAPTQHMRLQNTLGGNALTSATPTALSSHVDPRMLHAAAGMAGMGFVATAASATNEDGDDVAGTPGEENPEFTQVEIDGEEPAGNGYSETMAPPPAPSEFMRVTQIGENHPYPEESYQTQPLLSNTDNTELGYHSQSKHIPLENMTTLPPMQHQTTNFSFNNKPYTDNYLNTVQYYDTSTSDGMYCYSCIMFLGVLCIGIGIVLVIVEIFGLFGQTKYLAYSGGGVLFLGITTLASSMFAWRRHRSQIKKKLAHV